jgi:protein-glucosylgalactosylhydroxylysine glucosidase
MRRLCLVFSFLFLILFSYSQKIDRKALVQRHNVKVNKIDTLSSLTIGNGRFAFTIDATGLQTFPVEYSKGIPLGTQSEWGWHSFIDTVGYKREEALRTYHLNGRDITYMVQWNTPERNKAAANWYRQNPHRLQLGSFGFELIKRDGTLATVMDIRDISQELDLWTGEIRSTFTFESIPVIVFTCAHATDDAISVRVHSPLINEGRLRFKMRFPYPTGQWTDEGANYDNAGRHTSQVFSSSQNGGAVEHILDDTRYQVYFRWNGRGAIREKRRHYFVVSPLTGNDNFEISVKFVHAPPITTLPDYQQTKTSSTQGWNAYWNSGGAIDFTGSIDSRAPELERRIILSQYLMRVQEAGEYPPQETGLTYNSWFGKPHLEMHWWHAVHYALWGRAELLEKSMDWYRKVLPLAKAIAKRQGFNGARWQKMTDNTGEETPSSVGALLIWQQPHFIYFAELLYRDKQDKAVLEKYKDLVFATAEFMASFPYYDSAKKRYILGKGLIPAQERFKAEETFNPAYELVYWRWGLAAAQEWRHRLGLPLNKKWDEVIQRLSPLAVQENRYLAAESATDSYTNPEYRTDHPSVLAALGVMPAGPVKPNTMQNTFNWIWNNWSWKETWGWDFPMTAMTATRLGMPGRAIDALLMDVRTNTYLPNGHNYQDDRLRIYMPGNGGLLAAIAMMVAGYEGSGPMPGIPKDGKWKVQWEGLKKMP